MQERALAAGLTQAAGLQAALGRQDRCPGGGATGCLLSGEERWSAAYLCTLTQLLTPPPQTGSCARR